MDTSYKDSNTALKYLDFLNSTNGKIQKKVLLNAIKNSLPANRKLTVLDAGCGPGWLAGNLKNSFDTVEACDSSEFLIQFAKVEFPNVNFKVAELVKPLPYPQKSFDYIILNMVAPDIENLEALFKNLVVLLKPTGRLIMTIPNPSLTYPAAVWKRGILGFILRKKPKLEFKKTPLEGEKIQREFGEDIKIDSYYHSLPYYMHMAQYTGLKLLNQKEIKPLEQSEKFNLNFQLNLYPLLLLLEFSAKS